MIILTSTVMQYLYVHRGLHAIALMFRKVGRGHWAGGGGVLDQGQWHGLQTSPLRPVYAWLQTGWWTPSNLTLSMCST
jgi:hypothetical protein